VKFIGWVKGPLGLGALSKIDLGVECSVGENTSDAIISSMSVYQVSCAKADNRATNTLDWLKNKYAVEETAASAAEMQRAFKTRSADAHM